MSLCTKCGQDNPETAKFCNSCGMALSEACSKCGHANPPSSRFCNGCGSSLQQPSDHAFRQQSSSPESYTPAHLAEKILISRAALEGERKQVTVLFADVVGFSTLSEHLLCQ